MNGFSTGLACGVSCGIAIGVGAGMENGKSTAYKKLQSLVSNRRIQITDSYGNPISEQELIALLKSK